MKVKFITLVAMAGISLSVNANIVWDWSFDSEAGQFITDGSVASPGTYTLLDFSVTASATDGPVGSLSGGDYLTGIWDTDEPFSFYWDGSQVTDWLHAGINSFYWWTFRESADSTRSYDFGWDVGNINDPAKGSHFDTDLGLGTALAIGDVSVSPVPEPASVILIVLGSVGVFYVNRQ